jgi:hypothetical protein
LKTYRSCSRKGESFRYPPPAVRLSAIDAEFYLRMNPAAEVNRWFTFKYCYVLRICIKKIFMSVAYQKQARELLRAFRLAALLNIVHACATTLEEVDFNQEYSTLNCADIT